MSDPKEIEWTQEKIDDLAIEFEKGSSMSEIADAMTVKYQEDITRNAVLGKIHRLRMMRIKAVSKPKSKARAKKRRQQFLPYQPPLPTKWTIEPPGLFRCSIQELNSDRCHWPMGIGPPFSYCGAQVWNRSYCHFHYKLSLKHNEEEVT